jgi:hypothetical protein
MKRCCLGNQMPRLTVPLLIHVFVCKGKIATIMLKMLGATVQNSAACDFDTSDSLKSLVL